MAAPFSRRAPTGKVMTTSLGCISWERERERGGKRGWKEREEKMCECVCGWVGKEAGAAGRVMTTSLGCVVLVIVCVFMFRGREGMCVCVCVCV